MTDQEIQSINMKRLGEWADRLTDEHCTAFVVVGLGHDHELGKWTICCLEETTDADLLYMLKEAARLIRQGGRE